MGSRVRANCSSLCLHRSVGAAPGGNGKDLAPFHFGNEVGLKLLQQGQIIHSTHAIIAPFFHQLVVILYNVTQNRCFEKWGKLRHFGVKSSL